MEFPIVSRQLPFWFPPYLLETTKRMRVHVNEFQT